MKVTLEKLGLLIRNFLLRDERFGLDDHPKSIALAMGESDKDRGPVDPCPDERVVQGRITQDDPAWQESRAQMGGGSSNVDVQNQPKTG